MGIAAMALFSSAVLRAAEDAPSQIPGVAPEDYTLQAGDRVTIRIYPEDEYLKGGEMEVSSEGNITLPLVGKIFVAGKTVVEAQKVIVGLLAEDYLVNPEVVIEVLQYKKQSFVVLGQVKKPGTYEIPPGAKSVTLLQAISIAGGFSDIANIKKIKVMRKTGGGESQSIHANAESIIAGSQPDVELRPGDIVHVSESRF